MSAYMYACVLAVAAAAVEWVEGRQWVAARSPEVFNYSTIIRRTEQNFTIQSNNLRPHRRGAADNRPTPTRFKCENKHSSVIIGCVLFALGGLKIQ